jgi:beta-N-acetylhexosaminidase
MEGALSLNGNLPKTIAPIIFGCTGLTLDGDEKAFFKDASPAGFILFKKNCDNPDQVRALVSDLRACVGWHAPVLIDQEGGRVQRLRPPHWPDFAPARSFGDVFGINESRAIAELQTCVQGLAKTQLDMGINVNCIPVLDVVPDGLDTRAIDDRAFSSDCHVVAKLGVEAINTAIAAGMTPVMKHIPGHGRATVDSHFELPKVSAALTDLEQFDWMPFKMAASAVDNAKLWGMTAHVIYTALDAGLPATLSPTIIQNIIRGVIGFDGLLLSDDLFMEALKPWGDVPARVALCLKAGCDLALPCHGTVAERAAMLNAAPAMRDDTRRRLEGWYKIS